ncbi:MAG: YkgJ family cysteine cluster protein [Bryobacteraceae bacterium]
MTLLTDLVQIKRLGEKKLQENERFRRYMKAHDFPERRFRRVAEEIEERTDCRACANCCKVAETDITERDVDRLARALGIAPKQFVLEYTTMSVQEEGETILRRNQHGCIFLDGNDCTIYDDRPDTCRNFPHLVRGAGSIESRMWQMIDRATYCPIVYNSLEEYKEIAGFKMGSKG